MRSDEQTMKNFLYSLFIGLFGIAGLTSIAFLWMYAAQSIQQAHLYSDIAAVRTQDTQPEIALQSSVATPWQARHLVHQTTTCWGRTPKTPLLQRNYFRHIGEPLDFLHGRWYNNTESVFSENKFSIAGGALCLLVVRRNWRFCSRIISAKP